jgi:hypothetical protein
MGDKSVPVMRAFGNNAASDRQHFDDCYHVWPPESHPLVSRLTHLNCPNASAGADVQDASWIL